MSPNQKLFDTALARIRKQGEPSVDKSRFDGDPVCVYRYNGKMCAFGPAIERYEPEMEGLSASELLADWSDHLYEWAREVNSVLALHVQSAHDQVADEPDFPAEFEKNMRAVAKRFNLIYTEQGS